MHSGGFSGAYCLQRAGAPGATATRRGECLGPRLVESEARMMGEAVSAQVATFPMVNFGQVRCLPKLPGGCYLLKVNLLSFQKPSRYINSELNSIHKKAPLKTALAFPDIYEIEMSHLGLKILYDIINRLPFASAERVFSPWTDLED